MPKLQSNQNMNNYEFLIIFIQKSENLTAISIFPNLIWLRHFSKDVFIIEEQFYKSLWQLVKR